MRRDIDFVINLFHKYSDVLVLVLVLIFAV